MSETVFRYAAVDRAGRRTSGRLDAASRAEAASTLRRQGLTPVTLAAATRAARRPGKVPRERVADLTRELSVLVRAGIPVADGLRGIAEQSTDDALRPVVRDLAAKVEAGVAISKCLAAHPAAFDPVFVGTIRAAEASGDLARVLNHLAEMLDRQVAAAQALRRALSYPAVVLSFIAMAVVVLLVFVIPRFSQTFAANGVELPLITRFVEAASESLRGQWWGWLAAAAAAAGSARLFAATPRGRAAADRALLHVPYVSDIVVSDAVARFGRVLAISLDAGLGVTESVVLAADSTGRAGLRRQAERMVRRMNAGDSFAAALTPSPYLPGFARRMLAAGKDSAELAKAARVVAEHYDRRTDHLSKSIGTLLEPVITVFLAAVVLLISLSVFLPLWQMVRVSR